MGPGVALGTPLGTRLRPFSTLDRRYPKCYKTTRFVRRMMSPIILYNPQLGGQLQALHLGSWGRSWELLGGHVCDSILHPVGEVPLLLQYCRVCCQDGLPDWTGIAPATGPSFKPCHWALEGLDASLFGYNLNPCKEVPLLLQK